MIIERTNYWAKPGRRDEVLRVRRQASAVRRQLGLPMGTIFVKQNADDDGPDVQWECAFASRATNEADMAARAASADFDTARGAMQAVTDRFERHLIARAPIDEAAHWAGNVDLTGHAIAPREVHFPSGDLSLAGYLYVPPGAGPFPCMITNHGSTIDQGTTDVCRPAVAATLMHWGIASFLPHRRGYGNSPGPAWRQEVPGDFGSPAYDEQLVGRLDHESDDVVAGLAHLQTVPQIIADHIGVMGSSFGGINTLLAAAKAPALRCAVEFAGAAMNWERTPLLRQLMADAARSLTQPIFFIQAENDYSTGPTRDLAAALADTDVVAEAKIYPAFGLTKDEGHVFERNGTMIWGPDVRRFLERWL